MITIRPIGNTNQVKAMLKKMPRNFLTANKRFLAIWGQKMVKTAEKGMTHEAKSGRTYKTKRGLKRASAPGQYPAVITGTLRKSLDFTVKNSTTMEYGASARYASYLEKGTSRIKPRPFLKKSIEQSTKNIIKEFDIQMRKKVFRT